MTHGGIGLTNPGLTGANAAGFYRLAGGCGPNRGGCVLDDRRDAGRVVSAGMWAKGEEEA